MQALLIATGVDQCVKLYPDRGISTQSERVFLYSCILRIRSALCMTSLHLVHGLVMTSFIKHSRELRESVSFRCVLRTNLSSHGHRGERPLTGGYCSLLFLFCPSWSYADFIRRAQLRVRRVGLAGDTFTITSPSFLLPCHLPRMLPTVSGGSSLY